jgi:hypothetical protein
MMDRGLEFRVELSMSPVKRFLKTVFHAEKLGASASTAKAGDLRGWIHDCMLERGFVERKEHL